MAARVIAGDDPGAAAHPAKNVTAAPGLLPTNRVTTGRGVVR